jgi:hypothetical protein
MIRRRNAGGASSKCGGTDGFTEAAVPGAEVVEDHANAEI